MSRIHQRGRVMLQTGSFRWPVYSGSLVAKEAAEVFKTSAFSRSAIPPRGLGL